MESLINGALSNNTFNIFLAVLFLPVTGQLIQPIPKSLIQLIHKNFLVKYLITIMAICRVFYPVNTKKLLTILISAFIVLYLLEILRKYD